MKPNTTQNLHLKTKIKHTRDGTFIDKMKVKALVMKFDGNPASRDSSSSIIFKGGKKDGLGGLIGNLLEGSPRKKRRLSPLSSGKTETARWPSSRSRGSSRRAKPGSRPSPSCPSPSLTKSSCRVRAPLETGTEAARQDIGDGHGVHGVHHDPHQDQGGRIPPASKKIDNCGTNFVTNSVTEPEVTKPGI